MIAEIDITQSQPRLLRSYEWGLDVSETLEGAGGVGGLVVEWCYRVSGGTTSREVYAPCYDWNGNVMALVSLSRGEVVGQYEYGAFGETISVEGDWAVQGNPVRFSTKYGDAETGLLYDTHRYYEAATGRWLSRDPIEEQGGVNLYGMCGNDAVNRVDVLGMASLTDLLEQRMLYFYNNHSNQVGSKHPNPPPGCTKTDCITYCYQVIEWAYQQMGQKSIADQVYKKRTKGTDLAMYLQSIGWKAIYWNPDISHPADGQGEHPVSYKQAKAGAYYGIPVAGMVINYRPTVIMDQPGFWASLFGAKPTPSPKMTTQDLTGLNKLKNVRFGYGLARGGMHTFLYGSGSIYEVHWTGIGTTPNGPNGLYGKTPFENYPWLSGSVLVPPDNGQY